MVAALHDYGILYCQNPLCNNPVPKGRRKYCSDDCRKPKWYYDNLSAECRKTISDKLDILTQEVTSLKEVMKQQPLPFPQSNAPALQKIGAPSDEFTRPVKVSEAPLDFEITAARANADINPTWNLLLASARQIQGDVNILSPEILAYGLRTGRVKDADLTDERLAEVKALDKKQDKKASEKPKAAGGPKQLAGANEIQFTPPPDDVELDFGFE